MTVSISTATFQTQSVRLLRESQANLLTLQEQLSTGDVTKDLSILGATQHRRLLDFRGDISRRENFQQVIGTLKPRLQTQDATLEQLSGVINEALRIISNTPSTEAANTIGAAQQFQAFINQFEFQLNEKVDDRYLYAGSRTGTRPVDLSGLPTVPLETYPFTPLVTPALASYDSEYATATSVSFSEVEATGLTSDGAGALTLTTGNWDDYGLQVGDTVTLTNTSEDATYTILAISGSSITVDPAPFVFAEDTSFNITGTFSEPRNAEAFVEDGVQIDAGLTLNYGITSNDPAFQKLVLGLRWAYAATQDSANYTTYMDRAFDLLTQARDDMRGLQAEVASNLGLSETTNSLHATYIGQIRTNAEDIERVDTNEVAVKLTTLSAQLQASYAATARITQLSIINYL